MSELEYQLDLRNRRSSVSRLQRLETFRKRYANERSMLCSASARAEALRKTGVIELCIRTDVGDHRFRVQGADMVRLYTAAKVAGEDRSPAPRSACDVVVGAFAYASAVLHNMCVQDGSVCAAPRKLPKVSACQLQLVECVLPTSRANAALDTIHNGRKAAAY